MSDLDEVRRIKAEVEADLLRLPGVVGVDVGYKVVGGRRTPTPAIRVYVDKKGPMPAAAAVPATVKGVPTDVLERRFESH